MLTCHSVHPGRGHALHSHCSARCAMLAYPRPLLAGWAVLLALDDDASQKPWWRVMARDAHEAHQDALARA